MDKVPLPGWFVIGWFAGLGVKYIWEVLRLPGYGIKVISIPNTRHESSIGADDLALWIVGFVIIAIGGKDRMTQLFGFGFIAGLLTSKIFEYYDTAAVGIITPASFAPFPPPT